MKLNTKIDHRIVKEYIQGQYDQKRDEQLRSFGEADPAYDLLFEIIDDLKKKTDVIDRPDDKNIPVTFTGMEDMILNIFACPVEQNEAAKLLGAIYFSEDFYTRFFIRISQLAPTFSQDDIPEMANIEIRSDEELLPGVFSIGKKPQEAETPANKYSAWLALRKKLSAVLTPRLGPIPKLAYAFLALLIAIPGSYMGISYYNTSYQLMLAEDLLQKNYRESIDGMARLSGDYGSKGISMLMDGDEPEEVYLSKVQEYTQRAVSHGSDSPKAKQLQAKVFIIRGQLSRADSVLKEIKGEASKSAAVLNDLGALSFLKEDWQGAISYFKSAISADAGLNQPYYNLAITYLEIDESEKARSLLNEYLELETDEGWKNAALRILGKIEKSKG